MKQFRGALISFAILIVVASVYLVLNRTEDSKESTETQTVSNAPVQLFQFEKHDVKRVEIKRPNEEAIILVEVEGKWILENISEPANRTMVNRIKHQLHDLLQHLPPNLWTIDF